MCGTPLPQRPMSTPGAQSTLGLTRVPMEASEANASAPRNSSNLVVPAAIEGASRDDLAAPQEGTKPDEDAPVEDVADWNAPTTGTNNYFSKAEHAESLDQFIAGFHYTPPAEQDEVTMTGGKPVLDSTAKYDQPVPGSVAEAEPPSPVEASLAPQTSAVEEAPPAEAVAMEPPPFATKGTRPQASERSRFLDLSEPPAQGASASGTSIGGPSFLGLSDAPMSPAYVVDDGAPRQSHWRAWTALIVIAIFAFLGIIEWRAEKAQSNNGPIGIMKMQIERLKGRKGALITAPASSDSTEPAQPGSTVQPSGSGPEMQVAPQPKPQVTTPAPESNHGSPTEKPPTPGAASNPAVVTPAQSSKSGQASLGTAKASTAAPKAQKAPAEGGEAVKGKASANADTPETPASKTLASANTAPGAEELAKSANASDAAAAAAWLWKSMAKGNPEAPVRLANMYIKGDGVPQSCDQALILLRAAAAKENAAARSRLGSLYATATCVPRDRVKAYEYMSKAVEANPNATWARDFREQLWTHMTPQERQQAQNSR
jgi:hypothetical protein